MGRVVEGLFTMKKMIRFYSGEDVEPLNCFELASDCQ